MSGTPLEQSKDSLTCTQDPVSNLILKSRIILEKLIVIHLIKALRAFLEAQRFITLYPGSRQQQSYH
jgi:hypothetical protein